MAGTVIYEAHPTMFRAHPFWFIGCIILIPVFGLGVLMLLYWYIHTRQTALTVTDRAVHVTQGFLNRILGVGTIQISTAGDQPEFTVADMPDPGTIREAISKAQNQGTD